MLANSLITPKFAREVPGEADIPGMRLVPGQKDAHLHPPTDEVPHFTLFS